MSNLEAPSRSDLAIAPAPFVDPVADSAMLPPPDLRVPALAPPSLPSLTGAPVVPPTPRFSLDEADPTVSPPQTTLPQTAPPQTAPPQTTPVTPILRLDDVLDAAPAEIGQLAQPAPVPAAPAHPAPPVTAAPDPAAPAPAASPIAPAADPALPGLPGEPGPAVAEPAPTIELPVVHADMLSPANEPLGAPPQVAMVMPALPTLAPAAPPPVTADAGPGMHQPSQIGGSPFTPLTEAAATPGPAPATAAGGGGRFAAKVLVAIVLAGVVGVGAHLGYDWWETRDSTAVAGVNVDGTDLGSWPKIDPPAIRYMDTVTVFSTDVGTRTLNAHREISSGITQAGIVSTDAAGVVVAQTDLDIRGDEAFVRSSPDAEWGTAAPQDAVALLGDSWSTGVFTVRELFPAEAMPYITVLESVERILPVKPLQPAAGLSDPGVVPVAISTEPTSMVWQYRVIIDTEAFRANETIVFQEWQRRIGRNAVSRLEAWVDNTGIVRQIVVDVDGTNVTHTLVGGTANSNRFDTSPLLEQAATPVPVPAEPTASEVTE